MKAIERNNKTVLITGSSGFIGASLVLELLEFDSESFVIGIDNMNNYYDPELKRYRLGSISKKSECSSCRWRFIKGSIPDKKIEDEIFEKYHPDIGVNLAAQAGVRYSIANPDVYIESNVIGFFNVLEACRHSYDDGKNGVEHLVYTSSSSVYGGNKKIPFEETNFIDNPVSLYAASKKSWGIEKLYRE